MQTTALRLRWREVWGIDPRSLALFRIGVGAWLLIDLWIRSRDLEAFFSDDGVFPRTLQLFTDSMHPFSLHMGSGALWFQVLLFGIAALFALALLVGYRTRWATVGSWILLISMHGRNPLLLNGGDDLLVCLLFWSIFLPLGLHHSVDRALAHENSGPLHRVVSVASAAILLQIAVIYVSGALLKTGPAWTEDGTALYYVMNIDWEVRSTAQWLLPYPELMKYMTFAVLQFELLGPLLLFSPFWNGPLRTLGTFSFMGMHFGFNFFMELGLFAYLDMIALTLFLPAWFWDRLPGGTRPAPSPPADDTPVLPGHPRPSYHWAGQFFVLIVAVCALLSVIGHVQPRFASARAQALVDPLLLDQDWSMFAPEPGLADGWFVFPGTLEDERKVDAYRWLHQRREDPVSWDKPRLIYETFKTNRWSDYFEELLANTIDLAEEEDLDDEEVGELIDRYWTPLLAYVCQTWNAEHPPAQALDDVTAVYMNENTPEPGQPLEVQKVELLSHTCLSDEDADDAEEMTDASDLSTSLVRFLEAAREDDD